jgi:putative MFS transporter
MSEGKVRLEDVGMTPFLKKVTIFSCGGPFLDGYVLALIGVALTQLTPSLHLSNTQSALIGASALAGIFVGTLLGGYVTDIVGRKKMFTIDIAAIVVCSIASMFADSAFWLVTLRLLMGIAVGADYPIATSLIAEFTPRKYRAVSMGAVSAAWYVGATAAAFVGYLLFETQGGWRWMLGSAAIPGVFLIIGRWGIPESPRWLAKTGHEDEARAIVHKVFGADVELETEPRAKVRFRAMFHGGYLHRIVFLGIMMICQVVPMFAIYTFGPQILGSFGFSSGRGAVLGESVVSLFFIIGTIPAMFWLNTIGRRAMLIVGLSLMAVALLVLGLFPSAPVVVIVLAFAAYAFFAGGPGILQWLYPNELFPTEIRASATGVAIAFTRIGTILSTYALPGLIAREGIGVTMLIGAGITLVGLAASILMAPETRGMTLAESSSLDYRGGNSPTKGNNG